MEPDARPRAFALPPSPHPQRVFVLGATGTIGTIGRATVRALLRRGHEVVCFVRARAGVKGALTALDSARLRAWSGDRRRQW